MRYHGLIKATVDGEEEVHVMRTESEAQTTVHSAATLSRSKPTKGATNAVRELPPHDPSLRLTDLDRDFIAWESTEDEANPRNWPPKAKWTTCFLVSFMTFVSQIATAVFAPGAALMMLEFGIRDEVLGTLSVSIYLAGLAAGPLIMAPMSEQFGRVPVLHVSNVLFCALQLGCARASNIGQLLALRLSAGLGGAAAMALSGGIIADLFPTRKRGSAIAIYSAPLICGPLTAPIIGAWVAERFGWRWVFYVLAMMAAIPTAIMFVMLKESNALIILRRRTRAMRKELNRPTLQSCYGADQSPYVQFTQAIGRPVKILCWSPIVMLAAVQSAFLYGMCYLLYNTVDTVFERQYGFSLGEAGLAYLGFGIGVILGLLVAGAPSDRIAERMTERNRGNFKPEFRLPLLWPATLILPIGLFWYGWTLQAHTHWVLPIVGLVPFGLAFTIAVLTIILYLIETFEDNAASALAANTVFRSLGGAFLPLAAPAIFTQLGEGWGNSLLGFLAVAFIPVPIVFIYYGERIRTRFPVNL